MRANEPGHYSTDALPDPPCRACGFATMCRVQCLACDTFRAFVDRGQFNRDAPRRPTSRIYRQLFAEEAEGGISPLRI